MAQLNFFATKPDFEQVFAFLNAETDFRIFESYSEFGEELREFSSFNSLAGAFPIGVDVHGNGTAVLLQMWSPSVTAKPEILRVTLDPRKCKGHTFRYRISGYGLCQLYLGGTHERIITQSHYGHFSERGASRWGDISYIRWEALKKLSGRFQRYVSRKLAAAKAPGHPVLPDAFQKYKEGYQLRRAAQHPTTYQPTPLSN